MPGPPDQLTLQLGAFPRRTGLFVGCDRRIPATGARCLRCPGQPVEKGRIVECVDVVHDPESCLSNLLVQSSITEPPILPGVDQGFSIVSFERDGVPLDVSPVAPGALFAVDIHPEEAEFVEVVTHSSLHLEVFQAKVSLDTAAVAPLGISS